MRALRGDQELRVEPCHLCDGGDRGDRNVYSCASREQRQHPIRHQPEQPLRVNRGEHVIDRSVGESDSARGRRDRHRVRYKLHDQGVEIVQPMDGNGNGSGIESLIDAR